jgi:hypothetical protein
MFQNNFRVIILYFTRLAEKQRFISKVILIGLTCVTFNLGCS